MEYMDLLPPTAPSLVLAARLARPNSMNTQHDVYILIFEDTL